MCPVPGSGSPVRASRRRARAWSSTRSASASDFSFQPGIAAMSIMRRIAGITLLIGGAALASCKETAVQVVEVATVEITGAPGTLLVGGTVQLAAVPKDDRNNVLSGRETTWTSSAPAVASVDGSGRVTGLTAGTATISASVEGRSASVTLTVNNPAPTL